MTGKERYRHNGREWNAMGERPHLNPRDTAEITRPVRWTDGMVFVDQGYTREREDLAGLIPPTIRRLKNVSAFVTPYVHLCPTCNLPDPEFDCPCLDEILEKWRRLRGMPLT